VKFKRQKPSHQIETRTTPKEEIRKVVRKVFQSWKRNCSMWFFSITLNFSKKLSVHFEQKLDLWSKDYSHSKCLFSKEFGQPEQEISETIVDGHNMEKQTLFPKFQRRPFQEVRGLFSAALLYLKCVREGNNFVLKYKISLTKHGKFSSPHPRHM